MSPLNVTVSNLAPERGVLYLVWGNVEGPLERSMRSLRMIHPELPVHVQRLPAHASLLDKAQMLDFSPFAQTLYLDADTIVLDRLDFGFDMAARHGLACTICECPWARRYRGIGGDVVEYNTGVLFFTRDAQPLFERWKTLAPAVDSSSLLVTADGKRAMMPLNDQASFAAAAFEMDRPPFVLPLNWNYRPRWQPVFFGPLKIWHDYDDPPAILTQWQANQIQGSAMIQATQLPR